MQSRRPMPPVAERLYGFATGPSTLIATVILAAVVSLVLSPFGFGTISYRAYLATLTEQLILGEVNPHRTNIGVTPLRAHPLLAQAAQQKAEDMLSRQYFAHIGPEGELPWTWLDRAGYAYAAGGENLAIDFSDTSALVSAWLASPSHAKNIENGIFTDIGIGIVDGIFEGRTTSMVVMFLGREFTPTVAAAIEATPPAPTPPPVPTPVPSPAPVPAPVPVPEPTPEPTPTPQPPPAPAPVPAPTPLPASESTSPPLRVVPPQEPLIVQKGNIPVAMQDDPAVQQIAVPRDTRLVTSTLLRTASAARLVLTLLFFGALLAAGMLMLSPAHRHHVRYRPGVVHVLLLVLLWLPEVM